MSYRLTQAQASLVIFLSYALSFLPPSPNLQNASKLLLGVTIPSYTQCIASLIVGQEMNVVHILSTDISSKTFAPFMHGKVEFRFNHLSPSAPPTLFEGPIWIFVDWVLPELSGLDMIRRLRNDPRISSAHITMVLEQCDDDDKRRALRAGADDYLIGPMNRKKILDRVLSLMSERDVPLSHRVLERGPLLMDIDAWRTSWEGRTVELTPHEFRLLRFFAENPNRALSRSEVIEALGRDPTSFDGRNVDAWVRRLRVVFDRSGINLPLRTVRSVGYVFDS